MFTLEALDAGRGDCLLLHFGQAEDPSLAIVDGGPAGTFKRSLRPRLEQLSTQSEGPAVVVSLLVISHIDDDHIRGILDLMAVLERARERHEPAPYQIARLWHNSFGDLTGQDEAALASAAALSSYAPPETTSTQAGGHDPHRAVVASVDQGVRLRTQAQKLGLPLNKPFGGLIAAPKGAHRQTKIEDTLKLTVVAPSEARIADLRRKWNETIAKRRAMGDSETAAIAAAYSDRSVFNLSSIVLLAEFDGKTMLLTGDARGDDILSGLREAGLLKENATLNVDLMKVPHHGSNRNVKMEFFQTVKASHYVISGDGTHGNPELETLGMIAEARAGEEHMLHLTHREGAEELGVKLERFLSAERSLGREPKIEFRADDALSVHVDLLEASSE